MDFKGSFEEFVKNPHYGIDAWCYHVNSWLTPSNKFIQMHLIRYEDLLDKGIQEILELYENLGLKVHKDNIKKGLNLSNMNNMSKSEELYSLKSPSHVPNFINKSKSNHITAELERYIQSRLSNNKIYQRYYKND